MSTSLVEKQQPLPEIPDRPAVAATEMVGMFERLATNPDVDVAKLERLIAMQERILERNAKSAFDAAFADMQPEIPEIDEKGIITNKTGGVQSKYAKNEDMQKVLRPILHKHGFALSFRTEWPDANTIKIFGVLTHREGHSRESEFRSKADDSGNKNAVQALGSTVSYGHRYTTKDLLNITTRGMDDDGAGSGKAQAPEEPAGYADWLENMEAVADEGLARLQVSFQQSARKFTEYLTKHEPQKWRAIKAKAEKVKAVSK